MGVPVHLALSHAPISIKCCVCENVELRTVSKINEFLIVRKKWENSIIIAKHFQYVDKFLRPINDHLF